MKSHPFQKSFSRHSEATHLHAENSLILKGLRILGAEDLRKSKIYLARARLTNTGEWETGNCCPCEGCQRALVAYGIKEVVFTLDGSGIARLCF